ncbi:tripartite tricarboxylate transporter permease [Paenibacillus sp. IB182496]|uniref:Tripartite tricarboxylate transporter permease n=1 Tax=Paenibacillus sabuli TaxID=2772509 RepID=A0A927GTW9_9BACL|nr:tripartite tricarboxylate transporter permease [Paenibacillus sabuli]MBD2848058.1 tripartite tricarboxylate transporter permease [Paenibacillus sabuli]
MDISALFSELFSLSTLLFILLGSFVGLVMGALPGLGTMLAIVILLPITYVISPLGSILMLLSAYQSSEYGGSISAIILGIPGTPAAAATVLDGYALAKNESPGKAISYSLVASTIGGIFGGLVLIFLSKPLATFALHLSDPEFFLICIIGVIAVGMLSTKDKLKSLISVVIGLMLGTIGMDLFTGKMRFTLDRPELSDGINIVALMIGVFAFSEILSMLEEGPDKRHQFDKKSLKGGLTWKELKGVRKPITIGSVIGSVVGIFPGLGVAASSWFSYMAAKRFSKDKEKFGKGSPEGIAGPESANNATVGGSLVPLLSLGIPGSPAIAVVMGAFIIHGIQPGPLVFSSEKTLVYGIFYGFIITTIVMYLLGRLLTPLFVKAIVVPYSYLIPIIVLLLMVGIYSSKQLMFEIVLALVLGVACYVLKKLEFSLPSIVLAFVLGPIMEESLRRTLSISQGSYSIFFTRTYSVALLIVIAALIAVPLLKKGNLFKTKN